MTGEIPAWLFLFAAIGVVMMLYSIAKALENLVNVINSQNVVLNQIRLAIAKRTDD